MRQTVLIAWMMWLVCPVAFAGPARVVVRRVPDGSVQPQVAVDGRGVVYLIYLRGDPSASDVEYRRSSDGGRTWSAAIRVNSQPGSALAIGTVRGAQLALGRHARVHVAWMGSKQARPKAPGGAAPMLYARLADDGRSFEPQRNVIRSHPGVDGGGSVAADGHGNVFVAWHAPASKGAGEQDRRVWVARSTDDGATFAPERQISDSTTGACGCCGMRVFAWNGKLFALYRGAAGQVNRGMYLIEADEDLTDASSRLLAPMKAGVCVMSTSAFAGAPGGMLAAWESKDEVQWASIRSDDLRSIAPESLPEPPGNHKHPTIAADANGNVLVAWAEGTGWNKGGSVRWQLFDASGKPASAAGAGEAPSTGGASDLPAWDAPAVFCEHGEFVVLF